MKNTPVDVTKPEVTYCGNHTEYIFWALNVLQHDKRLLTEEEWDDAMTCMRWIEDDLENAMWHGVTKEDREYEKTKK